MAVGIPPLSILAIFSALLPMIVGMMRMKTQSKDLRFFFYLMCLASLDALLQFILAKNNINNHWVIHGYNLFEVPAMVWIYSMWFKSERVKSIYVVIGVFFILFWFVSKMTFESMLQPSTYVGPTSRVILTIVSIHALYEVSKDMEMPLLQNHRFWIASGTILYMSGAVMFLALQGLFMELSADVILRIFHIYWVFIIFINLVYSGAFLCKAYPRNSGGPSVLAQ